MPTENAQFFSRQPEPGEILMTEWPGHPGWSIMAIGRGTCERPKTKYSFHTAHELARMWPVIRDWLNRDVDSRNVGDHIEGWLKDQDK